jgi:hypothetical protein
MPPFSVDPTKIVLLLSAQPVYGGYPELGLSSFIFGKFLRSDLNFLGPQQHLQTHTYVNSHLTPSYIWETAFSHPKGSSQADETLILWTIFTLNSTILQDPQRLMKLTRHLPASFLNCSRCMDWPKRKFMAQNHHGSLFSVTNAFVTSIAKRLLPWLCHRL